MSYTTTIRSKRHRVVAALDIGTSKICCLIAKTSPAPDWFEGSGESVQFEVLGFDHTRAEGLKAGMITHLDSAEACIRSAVDSAERMAGVTVEDVHVTVTAGRLKSETFSASVALPSGAVREEDIMRLLAGGRQYAGRDKRSVLHALPMSYRLDENGGISDPHGMCGERLAVDLHAVTADDVAMRNLMLCVERCHLSVASLIAAPYSSALSVVTPDEAKLGVAVIDLGAGTTTLSLLADGHFVHADALALGGNGITTDIARALAAPLDHAERLKTLHGSAFATLSDEREIITYPCVGGMAQGSLNQITKAQLAMIVRPRIEEILAGPSPDTPATMARDLHRVSGLGGRRTRLGPGSIGVAACRFGARVRSQWAAATKRRRSRKLQGKSCCRSGSGGRFCVIGRPDPSAREVSG